MSTPVYSRGPQLTGAGGSASTLMEMATEILRRVNAVADRQQVTLPSRQIIYPDVAPADCAQVAVLFNGYLPSQVWDGFTSCQNFKIGGAFAVQITRETPAVPLGTKIPKAETMVAAAEIASRDAEVLLELLQSFEEIGTGMQIATGAPEGGLQTSELQVVLNLFGSL